MELIVMTMYFYMLLLLPVTTEAYEEDQTCVIVSVPGILAANASINYTAWPEYVLEPYVPFQYEIFGYSYLAIFILGCIGNILIVIVFCKNRESYPSTSVYLTALAVSDVITLLTAHVNSFVCHIYNAEIMRFSELACKLFPFFENASKQTSSWLLVAVTLERTVTVMCPFKVKFTCTRKVATIAVIVMWMISYGKESHNIYGREYQREYEYCHYIDANYADFLYDVAPFLDIIFTLAAPLIGIVLGNILIIYKLIKNANRRKEMTSTRIDRERGITVMLVFASIAFLLTTAPKYIISMYFNNTYGIIYENETDTVLTFRKLIFLGSLDEFLSNLKSVLNFYLYCYSGSKFRSDLKKLFHCKSVHRPPVASNSSKTKRTRLNPD